MEMMVAKKVVMEGDGGCERSCKKEKKVLLNKTKKNKKSKVKTFIKTNDFKVLIFEITLTTFQNFIK